MSLTPLPNFTKHENPRAVCPYHSSGIFFVEASPTWHTGTQFGAGEEVKPLRSVFTEQKMEVNIMTVFAAGHIKKNIQLAAAN